MALSTADARAAYAHCKKIGYLSVRDADLRGAGISPGSADFWTIAAKVFLGNGRQEYRQLLLDAINGAITGLSLDGSNEALIELAMS